MEQERNNIVLIGMPSAGKSTLGIVLAKILNYQFVDADLVIQNQCDKTLQKLIDACGPEGFIQVENQILSDLTAERSIIATGGSAVYSDEAMKHLAEIGRVVYLQISYEELVSRLHDLQERMGLTYLFIAHDLNIVKYISDRIAVMYGGHIMELGPTRELFAHPQNPYTRGLLASLPVNKRKGEPLSAIPGTPPNLGEMPVGCPFAPRCARAQDVCFSQPPAEREVGPGHTCRCHFADGPCREEDDCGKPQ